MTGAGVITPKNGLNFNLIAKLNNAAAGAAGGIASIVGVSGQRIDTLPFRVEGTTSKPVFIPNVGGMLASGAGKGLGGVLGDKPGSNQNQANQPLQDTLGGLFGKKKPKQ